MSAEATIDAVDDPRPRDSIEPAPPPPEEAPPGDAKKKKKRLDLKEWFRDPNPILVKELRTIFRTKLFIRFLYLSTGLVALIVLASGAAMAADSLAPAQVGQIVFQFFFSMALTVLCLIAPAHAATALTGERETGTYESLVLTGMDPARIVWGKFLASFGVFLLVIVAFAPIVGIAFLFGGISPLHVVIGFYGLVLVLAPAVALGVAFSARLKSTRVSILLSLGVFVPSAFFSTIILAALGEAAERPWDLNMSGPFWFTEALANRFFELDTFLLLGVMPIYVSGMLVWFFIASAIAGVRPAAEDRSTPFKWWAVVAVTGLVGIMFGITMLWDHHDIIEASVGMNIFWSFPIFFIALMFSNEPPLPPRLWELRRAKQGAVRRSLGLFGPGAAPTTRFAAIVVLAASFGSALAASAARHLTFPGHSDHLQSDVGLLCVAAGTAAVCLFVTSFGAWLRVVLRSGVAARVLTIAAVLVLIVLPLLTSVIIDSDSLDNLDDDPPFLVRFTPIMHFILGIEIADDGQVHRIAEVLVPVVTYGLAAAFFWVLLESRVRRIRTAVNEQRAKREEAAAEAARSRSSFIPPALASNPPPSGDGGLQRTSTPEVKADLESPEPSEAPEPSAEPKPSPSLGEPASALAAVAEAADEPSDATATDDDDPDEPRAVTPREED